MPKSLLVLLMACWPALLEMFWWLPVSSKVLGASWSVPDSFSDCFVREVLGELATEMEHLAVPERAIVAVE